MAVDQLRYTPQFADHMMSPRHLAAASGPSFVPDGEGRVAGTAPGTSLTVWISVDAESRISRIAWRAAGLPQVVASTSAMAEWLEMRYQAGAGSLEEALALTPEAVAELLGGLPARKIHESVLGPRALRAAIGDRFRRLGLAAESGLEPGVSSASSPEEERLCQCVGVTAGELKTVALAGGTFEDARDRLGLSTGCGSCEPDARALHTWFRQERLRTLTSLRSPLDDG